jgi:protein gp37
MSDRSKIEWTQATWNAFVGCTIVSPGCTHCYAMRMAARLEAMGRGQYQGTTKKVNGHPVWTGRVNLAPDHILRKPFSWNAPRMIFVNSMSDLFHEDVSDEEIDRIFVIMGLCGRHTFQVLTKRAERMRDYMAGARARVLMRGLHDYAVGTVMHRLTADWPPPNVWLGVSAERQREADERIPHLLATPAAVRFLSAEPLLGPIQLHERLGDDWLASGKSGERRGLDWVIVGGESGPRARPMHPQWARDLRDQCQAAGVSYFFKQWGEWTPTNMISGEYERVGKKAAGRRLDGRTWDEMPTRASTA